MSSFLRIKCKDKELDIPFDIDANHDEVIPILIEAHQRLTSPEITKIKHRFFCWNPDNFFELRAT